MEENKYEAIDVEVEEEVLEVEGEMIETEPTFSDDEIDSMCLNLKTLLKENNYESNEEIYSLAKSIASNSKEYLDNDTYLWTMYAYASYYRSMNNKNAQRWCEIRMNSVLSAMKGKRTYQKALTFKELGLSNSAAAKKLLVSSNAYLKKTVLRVGEKQLSYEEYEALIKAEKESKAKGKKTATAATSTTEAKTVSEFYSFDINEAKFYIAEDKRDYASRLLGINDVTVTKTVLGCVLVFGFYLILLFAMPTLLSWINAVLA